MTISELIEKLESVRKIRGDLNVVIYTADRKISKGLDCISVDFVTSAFLDYFDYKNECVIEDADVIIIE